MGLDWLKRSTKTPPPGKGTGRDGRFVVNTDGPRNGGPTKGGDGGTPDGKLVVQRKHVDWLENMLRWRWLLDSYEGGQRYRQAVYGGDRRGLPNRNMFRHKREYPDPQQLPGMWGGGVPGLNAGANAMAGETAGIAMGGMAGIFPGMLGADPGATAQDDDYEYRRSRTPVPEFVAEAIEIHLAKVYDQEVTRDGPDDLKAWWRDVDGRGTPIDDWMRETIAPLLLVLGCLDVCLDHPRTPPGEDVKTRADELRLGLDRCVASYILPENMVWWRNDTAGRYVECLVREYADPSDRVDHDKDGNPIDTEDTKNPQSATWRENYVRFRLWNARESILFSYDGDDILERNPHPFGRVPIVRLVDMPKHRTPHIGKPRYEAIAEYQREYYNRDSELILSDTLQAHPFLSGAEDFCKSDNTLSVGPGYILPMKKNPESGTYQGWEFVSPPKDPAESLRKNKADIVEMKDRRACLSPTTGIRTQSGHGQPGVAASGVAKQLDAVNGHKLLTSIAKSASRSERLVAEYALMVLRNKPIEPAEREQIHAVYPAKFELTAASDMIANMVQWQLVLSQTGNLPMAEALRLKEINRKELVGLTDVEYERLDTEADLFVQTKSQLKEAQHEMAVAGTESRTEAMQDGDDGSTEQQGGNDPTGESAVTAATGGYWAGD